MTLNEALRALHRAGRIRSPWLGGMWVRNVQGGFGRVFGSERAHWPVGLHEIDLSDPATAGCLWALLVEAEGPEVAAKPGEWADEHIIDGRHPATCLITIARNLP